MADCSLCGKPAGWFKSLHAECATKCEYGIAEITAIARDAITGNGTSEGLAAKIERIAADCYVKDLEFKTALASAWQAAAEHFLDDGQLNAEEEQRLAAFVESASLDPQVLNRSGIYGRFVKAGVVRDVLEGRLPRNRQFMSAADRFNFQRGETVVWAIDGAEYYEDRTRVHYEGRSQGVSVRIMTGVYYRIGAYKGQPVETQKRIHVDTGALAITTKHLYFSGAQKSLRIRHESIVSITPYSDGIAIHRDASSAKPQLFRTGDGWFVHNLLANASNVRPFEAIEPSERVSRGLLGTPRRR